MTTKQRFAEFKKLKDNYEKQRKQRIWARINK
jgi:hypothetical protein